MNFVDLSKSCHLFQSSRLRPKLTPCSAKKI